VSNVLFAHFWLKERLNKRDIFGTCLIILGSTLSVAFGNHTTVTYTMDQLKNMYLETMFAVYAFVLLGCCAALFVVVLKLEPTKKEMVDKCQQYEQAILAEPHDPDLIQALDARIAELEVKYQPYEKLHPFCYCALSGCLGAQSILFGKMVRHARGGGRGGLEAGRRDQSGRGHDCTAHWHCVLNLQLCVGVCVCVCLFSPICAFSWPR